MNEKRHTITETFIVRNGEDGAIMRHRAMEALLHLEKRVPPGANLLPLPALNGYKTEIHIHYSNGYILPMEVAIREQKDREGVIYEYSTDYEL